MGVRLLTEAEVGRLLPVAEAMEGRLEDVACGARVLEKARTLGVGRELPIFGGEGA